MVQASYCPSCRSILYTVDRTCSPGSFRCDSNAAEGHYPCIAHSLVCDGTRNCLHGEDEQQDCPVRTCALGQFTCANGICLDMRWHCDRDNDCGDFSDEPSNCSEFWHFFWSLSYYWITIFLVTFQTLCICLVQAFVGSLLKAYCRPEEMNEMPAKACTKRLHMIWKVTKKIVMQWICFPYGVILKVLYCVQIWSSNGKLAQIVNTSRLMKYSLNTSFSINTV